MTFTDGVNIKLLLLMLVFQFSMGLIVLYLRHQFMPFEKFVFGLPLIYLFSLSFILTLILFEMVEGMVCLLNLFY
jgi:hypothetical protein